ncbi:MAG: hypothetical protein ACREQ9_17465 [Candidatus Binatia bacterium]
MSKRMPLLVLTLALAGAACHSKMEFIPLTSQTIYFSDKFYDVKATVPQKALIAG